MTVLNSTTKEQVQFQPFFLQFAKFTTQVTDITIKSSIKTTLKVIAAESYHKIKFYSALTVVVFIGGFIPLLMWPIRLTTFDKSNQYQ